MSERKKKVLVEATVFWEETIRKKKRVFTLVPPDATLDEVRELLLDDDYWKVCLAYPEETTSHEVPFTDIKNIDLARD